MAYPSELSRPQSLPEPSRKGFGPPIQVAGFSARGRISRGWKIQGSAREDVGDSGVR